MAGQPLVGQGLLNVEDPRSHLDTKLESSRQKTTQQTDIHTHGGIRTHNLSTGTAANPRRRPRDHWDRHNYA
jgi:hypothetical protein